MFNELESGWSILRNLCYRFRPRKVYPNLIIHRYAYTVRYVFPFSIFFTIVVKQTWTTKGSLIVIRRYFSIILKFININLLLSLSLDLIFRSICYLIWFVVDGVLLFAEWKPGRGPSAGSYGNSARRSQNQIKLEV